MAWGRKTSLIPVSQIDLGWIFDVFKDAIKCEDLFEAYARKQGRYERGSWHR